MSWTQQLLRPWYAKVLFRDSFTDANGTSLDAHTPDVDASGAGWSEIHGDYDIQSNRAHVVATGIGPVAAIAVVDLGLANARLRVKINYGAAGDIYGGLCARVADDDNLWYLVGSAATGNIVIVERNGGGNTTRASAAAGITSGVDYELSAVLDGQHIELTLDGSTTISYSSALFNETETSHGMYTGGDVNWLDDFEVRTL